MNPPLSITLYVNEERVPEALVLEEAKRLRSLSHFGWIVDRDARELQIFLAAESCAIELCIDQAAGREG